MKTKIYKELATLINARKNCIKSNNTEWFENHTDTIEKIIKRTAPSGSGINCGTKIDLEKSTSEKLIFTFSFHYMNDTGYYDGWYDYRLTVKPSLQFGISISLTGSNRGEIKDYLYETYDYWLHTEIETADFQ